MIIRLTSEKIFEDMKKLGCTAPVVKIIEIKPSLNQTYNKGTDIKNMYCSNCF